MRDRIRLATGRHATYRGGLSHAALWKDIVAHLKRPTDPTPKCRVLLTAPHCHSSNPPLDDPLTLGIAKAAAEELCRLQVDVTLVHAGKTRMDFDQNRFPGLDQANDMLPHLNTYLKACNHTLSDVLHVDIHSFTHTDPYVTDTLKWGTSFNWLTLHGDALQKRLAEALSKSSHMNVKLQERSRVRPMSVLPTTVNHSENNAQISWSKYYGAASVLVECPVRLKGRELRDDVENNYVVRPGCGEEETPRTYGKRIANAVKEALDNQQRWLLLTGRS